MEKHTAVRQFFQQKMKNLNNSRKAKLKGFGVIGNERLQNIIQCNRTVRTVRNAGFSAHGQIFSVKTKWKRLIDNPCQRPDRPCGSFAFSAKIHHSAKATIGQIFPVLCRQPAGESLLYSLNQQVVRQPAAANPPKSRVLKLPESGKRLIG